jgi:hypothetical protein
MRRLLSLFSAALVLSVAGCHTCDVCDDCGDGCGSCGSNGYHSRVYGDPGFAPGYVTPEYEGTVTNSQKRIPMQTLPTKSKSMQATKEVSERIVR